MDASNSNENAPQASQSHEPKKQSKNKITKAEKEEMKQRIKRGFGSGDYSTREVNPIQYPGDYWQKGILLVYDRAGTKVDSYAYCRLCDDVLYAPPGNGSAPYQRHMKGHGEQAKVIVTKLELASAIHEIMRIAVNFNKVIDIETLAGFIPNKW